MLNIILGASGRVGSAVVDHLQTQNTPVKAVVHTDDRVEIFKQKGVPVVVADSFQLSDLQTAFVDGNTVFVLTPETGDSNDVIGDTEAILANYRTAIESSPIEKIVGLSSVGAQFPVGNLKMSYLLERAFTNMKAQSIFVRPGYYFSNWLSFVPQAKEQGILPTFYPVDLKIPMTSPSDVAEFVANIMTTTIEGSPIYELEGPDWYSSNDVADALGEVLKRDVNVEQIPEEKWHEQLRQIGFTEDAIKNFIAMTELVADGKAQPERNGRLPAKTKTTLQQYLSDNAIH
ncbi:MAG: NAD(P)H-binding protein [Fibrella sp.]|nr:NAD(P)H-binding protein [Armatimonadota bacterium]